MVLPASKTLLLKLVQVNEEEMNYKIGSEFAISEGKVEFKNYEGHVVTVSKNFLENPVVLGKIKPGLPFPTIYYDPQIRSVQERQLEIIIKTLEIEADKDTFFILGNSNAVNPTSLVIDETPVLLAKGMLLDVGGYLIEVEDIEPNISKTDDNMNNPLICFSPEATSGLPDDEELTMQIKPSNKANKNKKVHVLPPEISLKILNGTYQNNDSLDFAPISAKHELEIRIGSEKDSEIRFDKLLPEQLKIKYDADLKKWVAVSDGKATDRKTAAFVCLVSALSFKEKKIEKGMKFLLNLRNGMRIGFGGNIFEAQIL